MSTMKTYSKFQNKHTTTKMETRSQKKQSAGTTKSNKLKPLDYSYLFKNDSIQLRTDTTFDRLINGSVYNQVQYRSIRHITDSNAENSNLNNSHTNETNKKSSKKRPKIKRTNKIAKKNVNQYKSKKKIKSNRIKNNSTGECIDFSLIIEPVSIKNEKSKENWRSFGNLKTENKNVTPPFFGFKKIKNHFLCSTPLNLCSNIESIEKSVNCCLEEKFADVSSIPDIPLISFDNTQEISDKKQSPININSKMATFIRTDPKLNSVPKIILEPISNLNSLIKAKETKNNYKLKSNDIIEISDTSSDLKTDSPDVIESSQINFGINRFITRRKHEKRNEEIIQINETNEIQSSKSNQSKLNINENVREMNENRSLNQSKLIVDDNLEKMNENGSDLIIVGKNVGDENENRSDLKTLLLKSGKSWYRSLSILRRRTEICTSDLSQSIRKGRKWRNSVFEVLHQQPQQHSSRNDLIGTVADISLNSKNHSISAANIASHSTTIHKLTLKIVPLSTRKTICDKELQHNHHQSVPGYGGTVVSTTIAHVVDDVSVLDRFDYLSLNSDGNHQQINENEESARLIILKRCGQTEPIPFQDYYSERILRQCRKIGEGVYGEVFMYKGRNGNGKVIKIIPIEGNQLVNGEPQKKFEEIISEIIITSELSNLRNHSEFRTNGFVELSNVSCVQGVYPTQLQDEWDLYDDVYGSENDSPSLFKSDQLYIILELANGGQDLEKYVFKNAEQSYALFKQLVYTLAVAESALEFEHRDMHWGNILISHTDQLKTTFRLNGRDVDVPTKGVQLSIIDFTMSRMTYNNCCIYNDLALDPELFSATGDYQFEIYRLMQKRNLNEWQHYEPYSNIVWLDYTLDKMITQLRYQRPTSQIHRTYLRKLSEFRKQILSFNSVMELIHSNVLCC